jgi:hypothetical protein
MLGDTENVPVWCDMVLWWLDDVGWEYSTGHLLCPCDVPVGYRETKCPDLGDWSDTPHDVLDNHSDQWSQPARFSERYIRHIIEVDRERLMAYTYD